MQFQKTMMGQCFLQIKFLNGGSEESVISKIAIIS
jgi:hypothetical protein